jgi:hypothetical protein
MELKDFMRAVFERPEDYKDVTSSEKAKFFFMTQRFMSIAFPIQAQAFNHIRIPQAETMDYWQESMSKLYKKTPGWIYTKTKKNTDKKKKSEAPSDEAITYYLDKMKMSKRELDEAVRLFGDEAFEPVRRIETIMNEK